MRKIPTLITCMAYVLWMLFLGPAEAMKHDKAWIDLPEFSTISTPFSNAEWFDGVVSAVENYHKINKVSIGDLPLRSIALKKISEMSLSVISFTDSSSIQKNLKRLANIANNKAWYLDQLQLLYTSIGENENHVRSYFEPNDKLDFQELVLVNKVLYDFKLPTLWGLYWLEVLDPCHRLTLTPYYLKWSKEKVKSPFFLWLETVEVPFYTTQVYYLTQEEIEKHRIVVSPKDNLLYDSEGKKANFINSEKEYIYVLDSKNGLIVAEGSEIIRHTSLSLGKPAIGSGSIKINNGELIYIDVESGHYQPSPETLLSIMQALNKLGLNPDPNIVQVKYYSDKGDVINISLSELLAQSENICRDKIAPVKQISSFPL